MTRYVEELIAGKTGPRGKDSNMRWVASMVADVFRILTRGGVFLYPRATRDPSRPGRLLEVRPTSLHQRVPVVVGSRDEVELVASCHG